MALEANQQGIAFLLNQSARKLRARLAAELEKYGLDDEGYIVLRNVASAGERDEPAPSPHSIASGLHMPIESIRAAAARLTRDGWLQVRPVDAGEGSDTAGLHLTAKTKAVMLGFEDIGHWTLESALNGFTDAEIDELTGYLKRILNNLG
jgi:hypothetical protein